MKNIILAFIALILLVTVTSAKPIFSQTVPLPIGDPDEDDVKFIGLATKRQGWKSGQTVTFSFEIEKDKYLQWYDPKYLKVYLEKDVTLLPKKRVGFMNVVISKDQIDNAKLFTVQAIVPEVDEEDNEYRVVLVRLFDYGFKTVGESKEFSVSPSFSATVDEVVTQTAAKSD